MNTKHTPRPWTFNEAGELEAHKEILGILYGMPTDDEEQRANAKLIAAAPELLEALSNILKLFCTMTDSLETIPQYKAACEAIKKATE